MREAARRVNVALGVGAGVISLSGCVPIDRDPTAFRIVNETDRALRVTASFGTDRTAEPGDDVVIGMDGCRVERIEASWPDGTTVAVLDEEFCHDQVWTITGVDQATVTTDS